MYVKVKIAGKKKEVINKRIAGIIWKCKNILYVQRNILN